MEDLQQLLKTTNIKFIINILGLFGAIGGGWYKLENRVSDLEDEINKQSEIKTIQAEIELMKRDQELEELKFRWKLDSLKATTNSL